MGQRVDVDSVGSLLSLISHVHALLASDQVDQLVAVLADNHRSKQDTFTFHLVAAILLPVVAGDVVPADAVVVFVVEHGEARLVMELLQPLDGDPDVVLGVDGPVLDSLEVVRLPLPLPTKHCHWIQVGTFLLASVTYSPVVLQKASPGAGLLVGGMRALLAPAQNHPLMMMGARWGASQPLFWKLHFLPLVYTEVTLSKQELISEIISAVGRDIIAGDASVHDADNDRGRVTSRSRW